MLDLGHGQINCGRITGIIGPSGAGKSTFLNIIAGLDQATGGRIMYGYLDASGNKLFSEELPKDRMALFFQPTYRAFATIEQNICRSLKQRRLPKEQVWERASGLIADLGLTGLSRMHGWRLSDNIRYKAAFASAISHYPELLLLDEPYLDAAGGTVTADIERLILSENKERGMTVVLVASSIAQARRLCHELIFMHQGQIVERGRTKQLLDKPSHPQTRAFIDGQLPG